MKSLTYELYWPGTKIFKTKNNAFNWQGKDSEIMKSHEMQCINTTKLQAINLKQNAKKNITYS